MSTQTTEKATKKVTKAKKKVDKSEVKALKAEMNAITVSQNSLKQQLASAKAFASARTKVAKPKSNPHLLAYIRAIIDPEFFFRTQGSVRVPDAFSRATATLNSFSEYSVTVNAAAGTADSDLGRFCYVSNPTLTSVGWCYAVGAPILQYGRDPTIGAVLTPEDTLVLGANLAYMDPELTWNPITSLQALPPGPNPPSSKGKLGKPEAPPIIPNYNAWICKADPNAATIGGTMIFNQIENQNLQLIGGVAESIRPVAHCMWFQPSMAMLANGGNVSIALIPPTGLLGQIVPLNFRDANSGTVQWQGQGPITNWENLAQVPGAYSGPLSAGAYCYWVPSKISDIDMTSVAANLVADFPTIVCSGQWQGNPSASNPFNGVVGTIRITTLYEYTTCDQSRSTKKIDCVPGAFEFVQCVLKHQPTSMENKKHRSWIDKVIAGVVGLAAGAGGFMVGGPAGALAAGTAAGSATLALLES